MLSDEYATVKAARGMPLAEAQRTLTFPQYQDWRNYGRLKNEIAAAIDRLVEEPELAQRMGENGRKAVLEKYNWPVEEKKLLDLYASFELKAAK